MRDKSRPPVGGRHRGTISSFFVHISRNVSVKKNPLTILYVKHGRIKPKEISVLRLKGVNTLLRK